MTAGKHGLLYEKIDETGWPIEKRVGRHLSTTIEIASSWSDLYTDQAIALRNVPGYSDLLANGVGYYFQDPVTALSSRVFYE